MSRKLSSFIQGFGLGQSMVNTYRAAQDQAKIREIAQAKPEQSQGFTAEDGQQLRALADAKDEQGQSFYLVGTDDKGNYTVTPNPAASGMSEQASAPVTIAQQDVTDFLGLRTAGTMSPEQVMGAKHNAMADVIMARDPVAGLRMRRELLDNQRSDQRFGWEKTRAEREERNAAQTEADQAALRAADAEMGSFMEQRLKNPDGSVRAATMPDYMAATQYRAGRLLAAGNVAEAAKAMATYNAQAFAQIQLQTAQRDQALGKTIAAAHAGDLQAVVNFHNEFMPDGSKITGIKRGDKGEITIDLMSDDGVKMPPMVMKDIHQLTAALSALKNPNAVYDWTQSQFKNDMALRADRRAERADGRAAASRAASDGGAKPLSSMDRMLIDGRRAEARKTVDSIQDQLSDKLLTVQAQRPGPAQDRYNALQARLKEAEAEYQRWDSAMNELAMSAVGRAGLSSAAPAKAPAPGLSAAKPKPPSAAQVQGLPKGASIGAFDAGKGWQVKDSSGKLLGYAKE